MLCPLDQHPCHMDHSQLCFLACKEVLIEQQNKLDEELSDFTQDLIQHNVFDLRQPNFD